MNCIFYIIMVQFFIFQNLQVQTETLFEDRPLSDNVVPLEEFHAELQIESQKEHRKDLSRELKDKTKWKGWLNQMMQQ